MVTVTTSARRLEQRARWRDPESFPVTRRHLAPSEELRWAKLALQDSSRRLQGDAEMLMFPVVAGVQHHPWRTLGLAVAAGTAYGWMDDATQGLLSRFTWRVLRTRVLGSSLKLR